MTSTFVLAAFAFLPMIVEAAVSARNERMLRRSGAVEPTDDVIAVMKWAYPSAFAAGVVEGYLRDVTIDETFGAGMGVFLVAKALKYWAIATLGERWTFRVLVPPQSKPIRTGPYRFLRHPNYIAVIGELAGAAVMARAWITGPLGTVGFIFLIMRRIVVEERALGLRKV